MLRSSSKQFKELHRILNQKHQGPRTTAAGVLHSLKGPGSRGPACPCTWEEHRFSRTGVAAVAAAAAAAAAAATVAEVLEEMFYLQGSQALHVLENSLRKHLPESLKVYGTVFHMNQGNLFNLKALVDKWPDFNTVVIRPQEQDMKDDFDHYTNTYLIYSKDPKHCQEFLGLSEVINWKQHLQIQSTQLSLGKVIENLGAINLGKVKHTQCFLYMIFQTAKKLSPSLADEKNFVVSSDKPKPIVTTRSLLLDL